MDNLFSKHLELIYGAITYDDGWKNVLSTISSDLNLRSGLMHVEYSDKPQLDVLSVSGFSESEMALFPQYIGIDPWNNELKHRPKGCFYDADQIVDRKALVNSQIYQEVFKHINVEYASGILFGSDSYQVQMSFHASPDQGGFGSKYQYLNSLTPHLSKALNLNAILSASKGKINSLSQLLDLSDKALFLVDESLEVIYFNAKAEALLEDQSGIALKNNKLIFSRKNQSQINRSILDHIHSAQGLRLHNSESKFVLYNAENEPYLKVDIGAINSGDQLLGYQYQSATAAITVEKVFKTLSLDPTLLRHFYDLTKKEIQLIEYLMKGLSLKEIAGQLNRGLHTQRDHLKSIFLKTNTHNQQELIAKMATLCERY